MTDQVAIGYWRSCARAVAHAAAAAMMTLLCMTATAQRLPGDTVPRVAIPGHVLSGLPDAKPVVVDKARSDAGSEPVTLTVVLRRWDPAGFETYLADVYDPASGQFRKFAPPTEVSDRFGPSRESYDALRAWFEQHGFVLAEGSANRLTLTLRGTRAMAQQALAVSIQDYRLGDRRFRAPASEPTLPADLAAAVQAVIGLSDLATPRPQKEAIHRLCSGLANGQSEAQAKKDFLGFCTWLDGIIGYSAPGSPPPPSTSSAPGSSSAARRLVGKDGNSNWMTVKGTGQTIGILSFDTYLPSNMAAYFALVDQPQLAARLSQVHVNGGAPLGADEAEVLLDIVTALTIAPGADVVVYDAPFTGGGTSFQTLLNAMVNGGVTIISNSWAYCENQTTAADVQSIDAIFAAAAASGISAFNAAGDSGSTCLNGSPDTVAVPAGSPSATAVGGSSLTTGTGFVYGGEKWWDGTADTPATGQGGFGVSRFFARPGYQDGQVASPMRSVPDVVANADPAQGVDICQASAGGCPTGLLFGGTSMSAPAWAAFAALLNEAQGTNLGSLNPLLYPLAGTAAFHTAAELGSDFAHVGLGSPNLNRLSLALRGVSAGAASAAVSTVAYTSVLEATGQRVALDSVPADGATRAVIVVTVRDANGNPLSGRTVQLARSGGSAAVISPASAVTTVANGAAVFIVTNLQTETVTFTATNVTDSLVLQEQAQVTFGVPPAAAASIAASPTIVQNDGIATTTITVTLRDALARPTPGKLVTLDQGTGRSIVSAPNPSVTDANGQIEFLATNRNAETVTYRATDVTDGDLAVPGSATVTFSGSANASCVPEQPIAAAGYTLTPFSSGYDAQAISYSNVNFGCAGASNPVFASDGAVYVAGFVEGNVFRLPATGGVPSSGNELSVLGPSLGQMAFGKDGRLYATRTVTGGGFTTGAVYELDRSTGAIVRTLASNLTCPTGLAVDPLSGDLFFDGSCFGAGSDDPRLFRISNPGSTDPLDPPVLGVYATLPKTPNGWMSFAPDGTLYVVSGYLDAAPGVYRVSGTNVPGPPSVVAVPQLSAQYWVTVGQTLPGGAAKSLIVLNEGKLRLADITTSPPTYTDILTNAASSGVIGPDGCVYITSQDTIYRIAPATGGCGFASTNPSPALALSPSLVDPDPAQGATQSFTARFNNIDAPAGTPVTFFITGANAGLQVALTDANGEARVAYPGLYTGTDTVVASASVGAVDLKSNAVKVTWVAGTHGTYLSTVRTPAAGTTGVPVVLSATLLDISAQPNLPVSGVTIAFTLGSQVCTAVTDASGVASCTVVPAGAGAMTLQATFAGSGALAPTTSTQSFFALAPVAVQTLGAAPSLVGFGNQELATTSSVRTVVITNTGTVAVPLDTVALGGTNAGDFTLGAGVEACAVGASLAANGGACVLYVSFSPVALGARAASVTVGDSGGATLVTVPLSGTGVAPSSRCFSGALPGGGTGTACVTSAQPACRFSAAAFVPVASVGVAPPGDVVIPHGLLQFTAVGCGASATLTVTYPVPLPPATAFYKFGPTSSEPAPHWYALPAGVSGPTLSVTIVDGGPGDSDLVANGAITDPGGAGYVAAAPGVVAVPTLDRVALLLLMALMLACGLAMTDRGGRRRPRTRIE